MTDLRDHLADFEAAARRILTQPRPHLALVQARPAACHPDRPMMARNLCRRCYQNARNQGTLDQHRPERTIRSRVEFIADYELLRSEGYTRAQIAERLGMPRNTLAMAYLRAVRAGDLTPDRRTA